MAISKATKCSKNQYEIELDVRFTHYIQHFVAFGIGKSFPSIGLFARKFNLQIDYRRAGICPPPGPPLLESPDPPYRCDAHFWAFFLKKRFFVFLKRDYRYGGMGS